MKKGKFLSDINIQEDAAMNYDLDVPQLTEKQIVYIAQFFYMHTPDILQTEGGIDMEEITQRMLEQLE